MLFRLWMKVVQKPLQREIIFVDFTKFKKKNAYECFTFVNLAVPLRNSDDFEITIDHHSNTN